MLILFIAASTIFILLSVATMVTIKKEQELQLEKINRLKALARIDHLEISGIIIVVKEIDSRLLKLEKSLYNISIRGKSNVSDHIKTRLAGRSNGNTKKNK